MQEFDNTDMARKLRLEYKGAIYHITVRSNGKKDLFEDDPDRVYLLGRLKECERRRESVVKVAV